MSKQLKDLHAGDFVYLRKTGVNAQCARRKVEKMNRRTLRVEGERDAFQISTGCHPGNYGRYDTVQIKPWDSQKHWPIVKNFAARHRFKEHLRTLDNYDLEALTTTERVEAAGDMLLEALRVLAGTR